MGDCEFAMTDYETSFADLQRRLYDAEKELADLKQAVWGDIPASLIGTSLDGRIEALETTSVGALTAQGNPITVSGNETKDPQPELSVIDIEWGIPKTDPTSDSTATITLRPCEADGTEYDDADDVVVYLRNDRAEIQIEQRGWLATAGEVVGTILSFHRFPWDVGSPAVHGVLIGEGPSVNSTPAGETGTYQYAYKAHLIGFNVNDEDVFWTVEDVLDSRLHVFMELRSCEGDGATGSHPGFKGPIYHSLGTNPNGIVVTVDDTGDDVWHSVDVPWIIADGTQQKWDTVTSDPVFQMRITAAGNLEFRAAMNPDGSSHKMILYITVAQISRPSGILTLPELGTTDIQEVEPYGHDHEFGTADPNTWPWGDGKWRSL